MAGYTKVPSWFVRERLRYLTGNECKVYLALLHHRNRSTGKCYPSITTLAELAGTNRTQVIRAIKGLEKHKLITVSRYPRKGSFYEFPLL